MPEEITNEVYEKILENAGRMVEGRKGFPIKDQTTLKCADLKYWVMVATLHYFETERAT